MSSMDAEPLAAEHLSSGADRVQGVGLRAVFGLARRPVELDDPFAESLERDGEPVTHLLDIENQGDQIAAA